MSSVLSALLAIIIKQVDILNNLFTKCESALKQTNASVTPDDDITLYRLFGFSLHASIHSGTQICTSKFTKRYTVLNRRNIRKQLSVLKQLLEEDKTRIPAVLAKQDRGRMKFPNMMVLPYCRSCSILIKKTLNLPALMRGSRKISGVRNVMMCSAVSEKQQIF